MKRLFCILFLLLAWSGWAANPDLPTSTNIANVVATNVVNAALARSNSYNGSFTGNGAGLTNLVNVTYTNRGSIYVDPVAGNDTLAASLAKGSPRAIWKSISNAMATATFGDTVYVSKGTNILTGTLVVPAGVSLRGAGAKSTWFQVDVGSAQTGIELHSFCEASDFGTFVTNHDGQFRYPVAIGTDPTTNVICRNLFVSGDTDCFYTFSAGLITWTIFNCETDSRWDSFNSALQNTNSVITLIGCNLYGHGGETGGSQNPRGVLPGVGMINFIGGSIIISNGTLPTAIQTSALGSPGVVNVVGAHIYTYTASGTAYDISPVGNGTTPVAAINIYGHCIDPTKIRQGNGFKCPVNFPDEQWNPDLATGGISNNVGPISIVNGMHFTSGGITNNGTGFWGNGVGLTNLNIGFGNGTNQFPLTVTNIYFCPQSAPSTNSLALVSSVAGVGAIPTYIVTMGQFSDGAELHSEIRWTDASGNARTNVIAADTTTNSQGMAVLVLGGAPITMVVTNGTGAVSDCVSVDVIRTH